jgi:hypothetical protein
LTIGRTVSNHRELAIQILRGDLIDFVVVPKTVQRVSETRNIVCLTVNEHINIFGGSSQAVQAKGDSADQNIVNVLVAKGS